MNEIKNIIKEVDAGNKTEDEALVEINKITKDYLCVNLYPNRKERRRMKKKNNREYQGEKNQPMMK